jgi:predicted phage terminase large subunit-like protein
VWINTNPNNITRFEEFNLTTKELLQIPLLHTKPGNKQHRGTTSKHLVYVRNTKALEYPAKEFPVDPYVVGLLLGDGSTKADGSNVLHCHKDDFGDYEKQIPYILGIPYLDKRNNTVFSTSIKGISQRIRDIGMAGVPINKKQVPIEYFYGSVEQRVALLAGLLDTDGTVSKTGRISFSSCSLQLAKDVQRLVWSLGGSAHLCNQHIVAKHKKTKQNRMDTYHVEIWIDRADVFRLTRKRVLILNNSNRGRWVNRCHRNAITKIELVNQVPTQCIGVDSDDHLFIAGDGYVVTHNTGVRGAKEMGVRPQLALLDDLISDEDARSATVTAAIEDTVHKAVTYALHPNRNMIIWSGTPFNAKDPLYKAVESGAWDVNVYPVCEQYPCSREEFRGSWEDRFDYDYVENQYQNALKLGKIDTFNQELMLRIMSDDDRMIQDGDIAWYKLDTVVRNKSKFNFYITTDFATSVAEKSDFSVISVWAYNNVGDWLWVDGICKRQLMDKNIDDLFRLAQMYRPQSVGIEVTGQQGGFVSWIQDQMISRNIYFSLASEGNNNAPGIRPVTNKLVRFNTVVPLFKARKIFFPVERKNEPTLAEAMNELSLVSVGGFRSKHDDFIDTLSMLSVMKPWKPSEEAPLHTDDNGLWEADLDTNTDARLASYIV